MIEDKNEEIIFFSLIQNGLGFSGACAKIGADPMTFSSLYVENEEFRNQVDLAFRLGLAELVTKRQEAIGTDKFKEVDDLLKAFPSKPVLWGSGLNEFQLEELEECGVIPITSNMIKNGFGMYGNMRDIATAYCLEYPELLNIISRNLDLKKLCH